VKTVAEWPEVKTEKGQGMTEEKEGTRGDLYMWGGKTRSAAGRTGHIGEKLPNNSRPVNGKKGTHTTKKTKGRKV